MFRGSHEDSRRNWIRHLRGNYAIWTAVHGPRANGHSYSPDWWSANRSAARRSYRSRTTVGYDRPPQLRGAIYSKKGGRNWLKQPGQLHSPIRPISEKVNENKGFNRYFRIAVKSSFILSHSPNSSLRKARSFCSSGVSAGRSCNLTSAWIFVIVSDDATIWSVICLRSNCSLTNGSGLFIELVCYFNWPNNLPSLLRKSADQACDCRVFWNSAIKGGSDSLDDLFLADRTLAYERPVKEIQSNPM